MVVTGFFVLCKHIHGYIILGMDYNCMSSLQVIILFNIVDIVLGVIKNLHITGPRIYRELELKLCHQWWK